MSLRLYKLFGLVVSLLLVCGCHQANLSPVIVSLTADKALVEPSGSTVVECNATSINGGNLSYNWSASGGTINAQGGGESASWIAPADVGDYNITVSVTDDKGGEATAFTFITVRVNHPPAILSLTTSKEKPLPGEVCRLECRAEDPDNDSLNYSWEADGSNISGKGSQVRWTAPQEEGSYNITVLVTDPMGGMSTSSLIIYVGANRPPVIESLTADKTCIGRSASCSISCIASDPDDDKLSYSWSTARGSISGRGATVTWTAPNEAGTFTITVTVSDGSGGVTSQDVQIKVVGCLCSCP